MKLKYVFRNVFGEKRSYRIQVRAGVGNEDDSKGVFHYTTSPVPPWVRSVDEQPYTSYVQSAFAAAKNAVERTGKNITLTLKIEER